MAQFGRVGDLGSSGRRFKSCHPDQGTTCSPFRRIASCLGFLKSETLITSARFRVELNTWRPVVNRATKKSWLTSQFKCRVVGRDLKESLLCLLSGFSVAKNKEGGWSRYRPSKILTFDFFKNFWYNIYVRLRERYSLGYSGVEQSGSSLAS